MHLTFFFFPESIRSLFEKYLPLEISTGKVGRNTVVQSRYAKECDRHHLPSISCKKKKIPFAIFLSLYYCVCREFQRLSSDFIGPRLDTSMENVISNRARELETFQSFLIEITSGTLENKT